MIDHIFVFLFAIAYPVAGLIGFRRLLRRIEAGMRVNRNDLYRNTIACHWSLFLLGVLVWGVTGRAWSDLGFGFDLNVGFVVGALLTITGIGLLTAQRRQLAFAGRADLDRISAGFGNLLPLIPRQPSELARFNALSVTAGIVEETLWRGYLIWYLSRFLPLWAAAIVSAAAFGIAHGYQGLANVPRITLVSGFFTVLYLMTGSLWLPIVMHVAVDLAQGRLAHELLGRIAHASPVATDRRHDLSS